MQKKHDVFSCFFMQESMMFFVMVSRQQALQGSQTKKLGLIEIWDFLGTWIDSNSDQKLDILRFKLNKLLLEWRAAHTGWIFLNSQSAILKLLVLDELVLSPLHCLSCSSGYRAKRYYLVLQECYCGSWLFFKRGKKKWFLLLLVHTGRKRFWIACNFMMQSQDSDNICFRKGYYPCILQWSHR